MYALEIDLDRMRMSTRMMHARAASAFEATRRKRKKREEKKLFLWLRPRATSSFNKLSLTCIKVDCAKQQKGGSGSKPSADARKLRAL